MTRLLGLLAGLSLATDLGTGAPVEESLKRCVVATRLARAVGCTDSEVADVIYTSLLQHLGCTAYAHESAVLWGDDVVATRLAFMTDFTEPKDVWRSFVSGLATSTETSRHRILATTLTTGRRAEPKGMAATCEVARDASQRLGLPPAVQDALFHVLAMWNGKGQPPVEGQAIPLSSRIMHVAATAVLFASSGGPAGATAAVRRRAGSHLDPDLARVFVERATSLLEGLDDVDAYRSVLDAEPAPVRHVSAEGLDAVARTFGHLVDLKSPWLHGHSAGVGDLAAAAARQLDLDDQAGTLRVAGYLHDLGRVVVSSRIWDKPGPLSATERDQARLHPYYSERVLSRVPELAEVARLAGQHHERCDGSGYHRGAAAAQLSARLACSRPRMPTGSSSRAGRTDRPSPRSRRLHGWWPRRGPVTWTVQPSTPWSGQQESGVEHCAGTRPISRPGRSRCFG